MAVIYGIVHIDSGKAYVGRTKGKPAKRFREHRCLLRNGKHTSYRLQQDFDAHGESAFRFEILQHLGDNVAMERLKKAEQAWIDHTNASGLLYNTYTRADGAQMEYLRRAIDASRTSTGNRWTPETNERRSLAQLGKPKGHGAKISATKRAKRAALLAG